MTIIKRGKAFAVQVRDPATRRQVWLGTFPTKRQAKEVENTWLARPNPAHVLYVRDLRERWLTEWGDLQEWRTSTREHHRERTKEFADAHGGRRVDHITVPDGMAWAVKHSSQVASLRAMFGYGRKIGVGYVNPFAQLGLSKPKHDGEIKFGRGALTEEEVAQLSEIALRMHGQWHASLITFAAYTCVRPGELFQLQHADLGHDELTVSAAYSSKSGEVGLPKNGRVRTIVYPPQAREAVRLVPRRAGQKFTFETPDQAKRLTTGSYGYYWRQVRSTFEDGLESGHWLSQRVKADRKMGHLVPYELRHTGATILLERGVSHADVAVQMGHTDGGDLVMKTYGHPSIKAARDRLKAAYGANVASLRVVGTVASGGMGGGA